ncbi:hypothetical protein N9V26_03595 [Amylibacter sp.]|nr:hypothetical protein [Amylibacter sp.]
MRNKIHEKILELCHDDDEFLIIGGLDKLTKNLAPRDIDIFTTKTKDNATRITKSFLENAGLEYYLQDSPYGVLQFYILDEEKLHIDLLDIVYKYSALRSRMFFLPKPFTVTPKLMTVGKYNIHYDLNLLIIKNIYKPYIVGDHEKFEINKGFFKDYFDLDFSEQKRSTLLINGQRFYFRRNFIYWLCLAFYEKIVNAYLVNIKNVIFDPSINELQKKLTSLNGEIDLRIINHGTLGISFNHSRMFLFLEMPVSALKVTIINLEKFNTFNIFSKFTFNKQLLSFLEKIQ